MRQTLMLCLMASSLLAAPAWADTGSTAPPAAPTPVVEAPPEATPVAEAPPSTPVPAASPAPTVAKASAEPPATAGETQDSGMGGLWLALLAAVLVGGFAMWLLARGSKGAWQGMLARGAEEAVAASGAAQKASTFDLKSAREDLEQVREALRRAGHEKDQVRCREVEHELMNLENTLAMVPGVSAAGADQAARAKAMAEADGSIAANIHAAGEAARSLREQAEQGKLGGLREGLDALARRVQDAAAPLKNRPDGLGN